MGEVLKKAQQARIAAQKLAKTSAAVRNEALEAMADALESRVEYLLAENALDVRAAREKGTEEPLVDRLLLTEARVSDIAEALRTLAGQNDPLGTVTEGRTLYNGIKLLRVCVPLGVVAMIYEARPNVTADAAGLTLKTGNACILRGGSLAVRSNLSMTAVLYEAGRAAGLPEFWLQSIETTERAATNELMSLHGLIDVLIPRGSASLIRATVEGAKVPVIETGEGNCHLYVHEAADAAIVVPIAINAKTQRPGVCNAIESILVDEVAAERFVPPLVEALTAAGVLIHADATALALAQGSEGAGKLEDKVVAATEEDWGTEYLKLEVSLKCVSGLDEAIAHINTYSTHHSESILSQDYEAVSRFLAEVDSAAVYANASTRFTDGAEFGLGAEIGISTQKLHARGPMGLTALTSTKFILEGDGQIR
ncbi:MAG: glutamate-5-semialdehyde dehydrogenase [Coriobacteriales bacterium]|jgi:glutamate-5-semialdehyde dehydrogenase|nr:glutamate-5-semialdehyde dehydrogenase [Coriobacteriales bacterium]